MPDAKLPNTAIETFAKWVVREDTAAKKTIRTDAVTKSFREAISGVAEAQDLGPEEIQFCEGWLYFALSELADVTDTPDLLDAELKQRAERHIPPDGGIAPMAG